MKDRTCSTSFNNGSFFDMYGSSPNIDVSSYGIVEKKFFHIKDDDFILCCGESLVPYP